MQLTINGVKYEVDYEHNSKTREIGRTLGGLPILSEDMGELMVKSDEDTIATISSLTTISSVILANGNALSAYGIRPVSKSKVILSVAPM
jgi:hypothetical protein